MTQPHHRTPRSVAALLIILGVLAAPSAAGATPGENAPDPGAGDPPPACAEPAPTPDCPPDPDPEPEPEPPAPPAPPQAAVPAPPAAAVPPPAPLATAPSSPPLAPRVWTPARNAVERADRRTGRLILARVTCWEGPCAITAPRQTTLRIDGKRFSARVNGARRTTTGQTSTLSLQLTRAALRRLDRASTPTVVEVPIEIRSPAHVVEQTVVLSLR